MSEFFLITHSNARVCTYGCKVFKVIYPMLYFSGFMLIYLIPPCFFLISYVNMVLSWSIASDGRSGPKGSEY
jgi:hypothetical protein